MSNMHALTFKVRIMLCPVLRTFDCILQVLEALEKDVVFYILPCRSCSCSVMCRSSVRTWMP
jgi:hypothetical protein